MTLLLYNPRDKAGSYHPLIIIRDFRLLLNGGKTVEAEVGTTKWPVVTGKDDRQELKRLVAKRSLQGEVIVNDYNAGLQDTTKHFRTEAPVADLEYVIALQEGR